LAAGLLVALFSFVAYQALELDMSQLALESKAEIFDLEFQSKLTSPEGQPRLPLYLVYFGGVFALLRWWRFADPTRKTRLSLWSVCLSWLAAMLLAEAFRFPQIAGCLAIVGAAISIQLAAPWIDRKQRKEIRLAALNQY
jgi:hypothetical protein